MVLHESDLILIQSTENDQLFQIFNLQVQFKFDIPVQETSWSTQKTRKARNVTNISKILKRETKRSVFCSNNRN